MPEWQKRLAGWAAALDVGAASARFQLQDDRTVAIVLARLGAVCPGRLLVVTADSSTAEKLSLALSTFQTMLGDEREVICVPEVVTTRRNQWLPENEAARCAALEAALSGRPAIFLTSVAGLLTPTASPETFSRHIFSLRVGGADWSPEALAKRLVELDYDNEFEVHAPGEFARRGGILDLYSPLYDAPVRIEFFGNAIESLRFFLPDTQRSFRETDHIRIVPRGAIVAEADQAGAAVVRSYFGDDVPMAVCEPDAVLAHLERFGDPEMTARWEDAAARARQVFSLVTDVTEAPRGADAGAVVLRSDCVSLGEDLGPLLPELGEGASLWHWQQLREHLLRWRKQGYELVACCGGPGEVSRFKEMLTDDPKTKSLSIALETHQLGIGILLPPARLVLLSEKELFGRRADVRKRRRGRYRFDHAAREGVDLEEGVHAVHATHGVCLYHGIREIEVNAELQEVMELEFDDDARLYVPLEQAHLVSRYVGGRKKLPKLNRIGAAAWKNAKAAATAAAWDLAAELLRMEAVRKSSQGVAFEASPDWEHSFAGAFPYAETPDQTQAIRAALDDMERSEPMDRLLCGDVGYGKTEVAMRAAFRAVLNGKQVAVLVPTTVLAQQHFVTFRERMAEYPIEIEMISRFRARAKQREILERLAVGRIDIVIGTHRLLQDDVAFQDLGLVVIDEEQRFGVRHKQNFKQMRTSVDILTMTATPIPRTLYFSISGIRNLSTIMSAPAERLPITTIVAQYDRDLVRHVVLRELERQGQVYFLHNRVQTIDGIAADLQELIPEARFAVGHGQMPSTALENVMARFITGQVDVLVCTTIIESGLDIPNANTIVIDRADRFGLADLYQLRGRVGRYHRQAYAYLLLPPMGILPQNARQRLSAIRRYTHLGAGFKLALRDLEIRGAGNILGTEQSGHIAAVGFELYCKLLKEAVNRLEHAAAGQRAPVRVAMDAVVFGLGDRSGRAAACLPPLYVGAENVRIECYRRLNELNSVEEVDGFAEELKDRFGPLPPSVANLLQIARVRILAGLAGIVSVTVRDRRAVLETKRGLIRDAGNKLPRLASLSGEAQLRELIKLMSVLLRRRQTAGSRTGGKR